MEPKQAKVLIFDIETSPLEVYAWDLGEQNISLAQVKKDWSVLAWGAKWLGKTKTLYKDTRDNRDVRSDKNILEPLWKLLDEADIVVTQNGKSFDSRKLNARFIQHGMKPPSPYRHLDTYRIAKTVAEFTSHKLEYLTDKLCVKYKKLSHKRFPGLELWKQCLNGNRKAWAEMKRYNVHDVLSTEELYEKLKPWTPRSAPSVYFTDGSRKCGICGKMALEKRGYERLKAAVYQKMHCTKCGAWSRGGKVDEKTTSGR